MTNSRARNATILSIVKSGTWTTTSTTLVDVTGMTLTIVKPSGISHVTFMICEYNSNTANTNSYGVYDGSVKELQTNSTHVGLDTNHITLIHNAVNTAQVIKLQAKTNANTLSLLGTTPQISKMEIISF